MSTHANDHLSHHNGSETFTKYAMGIILTEGAVALAEKYQCFWLLDAICSHQLNAKVRKEPHQTWTLTKAPDSSAKLKCEDGNYTNVTLQKIPFTDFPLNTATLWLIGGTLMLPSEY